VIASFWTGVGGTSAMIVAIAWAVLVIFLCINLFYSATSLRETSATIEGFRQEMVPLLHEVTGTVTNVNKELVRVDGMLEAAGGIVKNAERVSSVVEQAVSSPLIKLIAFGAGASRAARRLRKEK
jgi:uncharacterized protein YoxC